MKVVKRPLGTTDEMVFGISRNKVFAEIDRDFPGLEREVIEAKRRKSKMEAWEEQQMKTSLGAAPLLPDEKDKLKNM